MREELDKKLCEKYPKIFANRNKGMQETCMCWGFSHGDGWYNIINALCANIQNHVDWSEKQYADTLKYNQMLVDMQAGNFESFDEYMSGLSEDFKIRRKEELLVAELRPVREPCSQVVADQVKEKFGTLRFYVTGGDEYVRGLISMAESMSAVTCEECGDVGTRRGSGWVHTYCDKHEDEYQQRMKERFNGTD